MTAMLKTKFIQILGRIGLMLFGITVAIGCVALTLTLFPQLIPKQWRDPLEQREANASLHVAFTEDLGDIFYAQPGQVRPLEDPILLAEFDVQWDADGFRIPAIQADHYPVVVLGDSYTEARNVEFPWTDVLAQELSVPVRNLGYPGYGPLEYQSIMEDYGEGDRTWVLVGFFEGNDLENIRTSLDRPAGLLKIGAAARQEIETLKRADDPREDDNYAYPVPTIMGGSYFELAFFEPYIWQLNGTVDTYADSKNMQYVEDVLVDIQAKSGTACMAVVYMPTKGHIYLQNIEPSSQQWILENGYRKVLDDEGWLSDTDVQTQDLETVVSRLNNQRDAVQAVVEELGIYFIDLTPILVEQVFAENLTYYRYDTHWNQAGHDLVGQAVAEFMRSHPEC